MKSGLERRGEEGSSLILALAFLSLFGLAVAAVLGFADTSFRTTLAVRSEGERQYAADGTVEAAIDAIRADSDGGVNATEGPCSGLTPPAVNGISMTVTCQGTKLVGSSGTPPKNVPGQAVLTTDTSGRPGLVQSSNNSVTIGGNVYVNSTSSASAISVNTASNLKVGGDVKAGGPCPRVAATPLPDGSLGTVSCSSTNRPVATPDYPLGTTIPTNRAALPASCPATRLITVDPGFYDSAAALNTISACEDKIIWFKPGVYYFDFVDAGSHEWTAARTDTYLTGGTPSWDTRSPPATLDIPGSCDTTGPGVMFVFGNDSRLAVADGKLELCATPTDPDSTNQQIAIYGARTGSTSATDTMVGPFRATSSAFSNPDNAKAIETTSFSDLVSTSENETTGDIKLSFNPASGTPVVPSGSTVNSVTMRVAYKLSNSANVKALQTLVTAGDGSGTPLTISDAPNCSTSVLCRKDDKSYDLSFDVSGVLKGSTPAASLAKLTDASLKFSGTVVSDRRDPKPGTVQLDGITLTVNYTPAAMRAWTGCTTGSTYLANQDCALLKVSGNPALVSIHGTIYAPTAPLDLALTNSASQVVDRGVVSSVLWLTRTASSIVDASPISIPTVAAAVASGRTVTIRAYQGSVLQLVAQVAFDDSSAARPVTVSRWSYQR